MTERQIEADETPCPLTRGEWLALLAAESQTVHGYKHLAVVVILAACSILVSVTTYVGIYVATPTEDFNFFIKLIYFFIKLIYVVIIVAVTYYILKCAMNIPKEEYENSKTIEEIISGDLTDTDEIRKQYYERKRTPDQM